MIVVLMVVFTVVYTWVPNKKLKLIHQIPGAVFSTIGWIVFSFFFSLYIKHFGGTSIYGSFSTIIFMMIWLYCCIYLFLIGANLNRYFYPVICILFPGRKGKQRQDDRKECENV